MGIYEKSTKKVPKMTPNFTFTQKNEKQKKYTNMKTGSKTGTLPYLSNILTSHMKLREKEPEKKVPATWELFCEDGNHF